MSFMVQADLENPTVYHLGQDLGTRISNNVCSQVESYDYGGCVLAY